MKKLLLLLIIIISMGLLLSCKMETSSSRVLEQATEKAMKEMNAQIGMPAIKNFQERKLAKMIFELRDKEDLITYAYIVNLNGDLIYIGQCIGFGLPYSVQYTSPNKITDRYGNPMSGTYDGYIVPQADPNGLFMPDGLSATWLMMIDPETGEARPVYVEPQIMVSPFKLH